MHKAKRSGRHMAALALLLSMVCSAFVLPAGQVRADDRPVLAPVNPDYLEWQNERVEARAAGESAVKVTSDGHALGLVPSRIDRSYLKDMASESSPAAKAANYPVTYDLRDHGKVTPVRDQGQCGSCWAFGAYASLESRLLPGKQTDLAENHLIDMHGFDSGPCGGGTYDMATAYLASWGGPIPENKYPYEYLLTSSSLPATSSSALMAAYHVQDVRIMFLTQNNLKAALTHYGAAVSISFYIDSSYYNESTHGYYCNSDKVPDHAVAIVGWDDNYSSKNFTKTPPGNGAYLVKNSWGTGWGDKGYFWMSYYDKSLEGTAYVFYSAVSTKNYNWIYQYDPLGSTDHMGYGSNTAWMANIFKGNPLGSTVKAVSFYAPVDNTSYTVYIYKDVTTTADSDGNAVVKPRSGTKVAAQRGTVTAGYHTVKLTTPAKVTAGKNFSIMLRLKTPGYNYPMAIEAPHSGFSSRAYAIPGQSYVSSDGHKWYDLTKDEKANVCLKAFGSK